jgi:hypothetical protein
MRVKVASSEPRTIGEPLPPAIRTQFEGELGHDFGSVRVIASGEASNLAPALGARAMTVGRSIVFGPDAYRPETAAGRALVAHELTHIAQRPGGAEAAEMDAERGVRLDAPSSDAEREAGRIEQSVSRGEPVTHPTARHVTPVLSRSLLGGLLGGAAGATVGAIGGALLGGLLGPAGAVIGGIVGGLAGLVGGAIVGDVATRSSRRLTSDERRYAHEIYHDSVDYDAITITKGSIAATGAARTIGNTINLQARHFKGDTMELSDEGELTLIHEMGHVWQYQNGGLDYIPSSLIPQAIAGIRGLSRNVVYNWREAIRSKIPWEGWNAEQQAECISDYNEALRRIKADAGTLRDYETVTLAEPYIERVRRREGAPGSSRRSATQPPSAGEPTP